MEKKLYDLRIDTELESFMTPLSGNEEEALEENIIQNGCCQPITVWDGVIVDGHHRYEICRKQGIPFAMKNSIFRTRKKRCSGCTRSSSRTGTLIPSPGW